MYEYSCEVKRVVDGDTIDCVLDLGFSVLHKCRVRLYGIDTPESRTRNRDEKVRGLLAKQFLIDSIKDKEVVLKSKLKDSKGKYGRVLATPFTLDTHQNFCEILVSEGHAAYYDGGKKTKVWL